MQESTNPIKLPEFNRPPVSEVALAIHFSPLDGMTHLDLGELREKWRASYPGIAEQPELGPVEPEVKEIGGAIGLTMFGFDGRPRWPRTWFISEDNSELIQIQRDRLVVNWRRSNDTQEYPHYASIKPAFVSALGDLRSLVVSRTGTSLVTVQYEVVYINRIETGPTSLADFVAPWSGEHSTTFLPQEEEIRMLVRYPINDADGKWRGRLSISADPLLGEAGGAGLTQLQLFARTLPRDAEGDDDFTSLDLAHEWVVKGFDAFTTNRAHLTWQKE